MKKSLFFLILIFCFSIVKVHAQNQVEPNQALADLIPTKKWFEIERFYQENKEQITNEFVKLWYTAETGKVFNRHDASIQAYEDLIFINPLKMDNITLISSYAQSIVNVCGSSQNYEKGIEVSRKLVQLIENDTAIDNSTKQSLLDGFNQVITSFTQLSQNTKRIKVFEKQSDTPAVIHLDKFNKKLNGIFLRTKWNNKTLRTVFDTGAGACYIWNREVAKNIGVKFHSQDTILMNGNIKGMLGMIDNLELGNFLIKNVPVYVSMETINRNDPKQVKCDSLLNDQFDIVLGLPIMMKLGLIEYNRIENTLSFPKRDRNAEIPDKNLFVDEYGSLSLIMKVANEDFIAWFDTGSDGGLEINSEFYNKFKHKIPKNAKSKEVSGAVGGCNEASITTRNVFDCEKIDVKLDDAIFTMKNDCDITVDKENDYKFGLPEGGALGSSILKYGSKAIFDFENMNLSIIK